MTQAAIERHVHERKYPISIITGCNFHESYNTLDTKAKAFRRQVKFIRPNKAQFYNTDDKEHFGEMINLQTNKQNLQASFPVFSNVFSAQRISVSWKNQGGAGLSMA